jgi:hypothetical protein
MVKEDCRCSSDAVVDDGIHVGQIYTDAKRPRRVWRITARYDDLYRLERADAPNVVRFPDRKALKDSNRYIRAG